LRRFRVPHICGTRAYVGGGGLKPTAMQDTLSLLQKEASTVASNDIPCDEAGAPN
jgi:hypothetical protein